MILNTLCLLSTVVFGIWTVPNAVPKFQGKRATARLMEAFPSMTSKVLEAYNHFPNDSLKQLTLDSITSSITQAHKALISLNTKGRESLLQEDILALKNLGCALYEIDEHIDIIKIRTEEINNAYAYIGTILKTAEADAEAIIAAAEVSYSEILGPALGTVISAIAYYKTYDSQEVKPTGADGSHTKYTSYDNHGEL